MATGDQTLEELKKQFLECTICNHLFDNEDRQPHLLPCLHTFCAACLKIVVRDETVKCALCRSSHEAKGNDITVFSKDNNRRELLDFVAVRTRASELICAECEEKKATKRCKECSIFLCEGCTRHHKKSKFTKDHKVEDIGKLKESPLDSFAHDLFCEKKGHENQELTLYCKTCLAIVCIHCVAIDHKHHDIVSCSDVSDVRKEDVMKTMRDIEEMKKSTEKLKASNEQVQESLCNMEATINREIDACIKNCIKAVEKRGEDLKHENHVICEEKRKILEQQRNEANDLLTKIEDSLRFSSQTLEHKNPASFLQIHQTITQRLQTLLGEVLYEIPFENDRVVIKDLNVIGLQTEVLRIGRLWSTSAFPPKTEVTQMNNIRPGKQQTVLQIRLLDYNDVQQPSMAVPVNVKIKDPNDATTECKFHYEEDGLITVMADLTAEGIYTTSVAVLDTPAFEGSIRVEAPTEKVQNPPGTKAYLGDLKTSDLKAKYASCSYCKKEVDSDSHRPLLLQCLHRVGHSCGAKLLQKTTLICPKCKTSMEVKRLDDLPADPLYSIVKEYLTIRDEEGLIPCSSGDCEAPSTSRCMECGDYMCSNCSGDHKKQRAFRQHQIRMIEDIRKDQDMIKPSQKHMCSVSGHDNEVLKMYCETCWELGCTMCFISRPCSRENHKIVSSIDTAYSDMKASFEKRLQELKGKEEHLARTAASVDWESKEVQKDQEKVMKMIDGAFASFKKALDARQADLKKEAIAYSSKLVENLKFQLNEINQQNTGLTETRNLAFDQMAFDDKVSFLAIQKKATEFIVSLLNAPSDEYPCQRSALRFLRDNIEEIEPSLGNLWTPDVCPWKTKMSFHGKLYVGQRCVLLTLQLVDSKGQLAISNAYRDDIVVVKIFDPNEKELEVSQVHSQNDPSRVDISVCPITPGQHKVRIEVMEKLIHGGERTFEVKADSTCKEILDNPTELQCGHAFCGNCLAESRKCRMRCPSTCGDTFGTLTGNQPEGGSMEVRTPKASLHLTGFDQDDVLEIVYEFPAGTQGVLDPKPGEPYSGAVYSAFLPDNQQGKDLYDLLKVAFDRKLVFKVGELSNGRYGVMWSDIPHKTSIIPNATYGFPDQTFFKRARQQIESYGITQADVTRK